jgi:hypothetical protein
MLFILPTHPPAVAHVRRMFNLISILIGLSRWMIAMVGILPFPLISLVNWIAFPIAVVGVVFGMLSRSTRAQPQLPGAAGQRAAALPHRRADLGPGGT